MLEFVYPVIHLILRQWRAALQTVDPFLLRIAHFCQIEKSDVGYVGTLSHLFQCLSPLHSNSLCVRRPVIIGERRLFVLMNGYVPLVLEQRSLVW